jgi:hypothetical protein
MRTGRRNNINFVSYLMKGEIKWRKENFFSVKNPSRICWKKKRRWRKKMKFLLLFWLDFFIFKNFIHLSLVVVDVVDDGEKEKWSLFEIIKFIWVTSQHHHLYFSYFLFHYYYDTKLNFTSWQLKLEEDSSINVFIANCQFLSISSVNDRLS